MPDCSLFFFFAQSAISMIEPNISNCTCKEILFNVSLVVAEDFEDLLDLMGIFLISWYIILK